MRRKQRQPIFKIAVAENGADLCRRPEDGTTGDPEDPQNPEYAAKIKRIRLMRDVLSAYWAARLTYH